MQGGEIKNCTSGHEGYYGAGVLIYPGAIFEMTGGKISGCTSDNYGAGVIMLSSGNTLTGGEISGNSAAYGGGIFLQGSAVISDGIKIMTTPPRFVVMTFILTRVMMEVLP